MKSLFPLGLGALLLFGCQTDSEPSIDTYFKEVRAAYQADKALATTAYVEKYWRLPGNSGFDSSIYHVERQLQAAGYVKEKEAQASDRLTYRLETRPMDDLAWEPVSGTLRVAGAEAPLLDFATNRNMININSHSTPDGGLEAEVVYVEDPATMGELDLEGKIVLMERHPFYAFRQGLLDQGALGVLTYNMPDYTQPEVHSTSIQFTGIPQDTARPAFGISLSYGAFQGLKAAMAEGNTRVQVQLETKMYPAHELTLVAQARGSEMPEEEFVFSAHVQEPGANDNASGVGCLMESARVTAELVQNGKLDPKRTLTFLWGDEITSTRRYVEEMEQLPATIKWGVSLDMVGQNTAITGGTFLIEKMPDPSAIWTRGQDQHTEWGGSELSKEDMFPHFFNDYAIGRTQDEAEATGWAVSYNPFEGGSDHVPFLRGKIPGLLYWHFTDVFYHTDNDRLDKVSPETLKHVGVSSLVTALALVSANQGTALAICEETKQAALARLEAELIESKKALAEGGDMALERDIINTWADWYEEALQTVATVELGGASEEVKTAIVAAQEAVKVKSGEVLQALED